MSDIDVRLLRYMVMLADELHFASAAVRLGITPPTLMRQIRKLEKVLDAKLVVRKDDGDLALTAAGEGFASHAREALHQIEEGEAIVRRAERGEYGRVEFAFVPGVSFSGLLHTWISDFHETNPEIDISMHAWKPAAQIAALRREQLDAGFTRTPNQYPGGLTGFEIYRQRLVLALPGEHPLTQYEAISPEMLRDEMFVDTTAEPEVDFYGYTDVVAAIGDFTPQVSKSDNDLGTVLIYVALGHGIAVVPQLVKRFNYDNVVFRGIATDPVPQSSISFVYRHDATPTTKRLIEHMQRHALPDHGPNGFPRLHLVN